MEKLTEKQKLQEARYVFPYHYLSLEVDDYRLFLHAEYLNTLNIVKNLIKPFNRQSILDAGCGDGRFCYEMRNENVRVVGVDYSERAIAFAKIFNPEYDFYVRDLKNLQFAYQFDFIVLIDTLEHIVPQDIPDVLENLAGALGRNGKLIVTVPSKKVPLIEKHHQHFTEDSLKDVLKDYFKITKCIGSARHGCSRITYEGARLLSSFLFPLRIRLPVIMRFYEKLNLYFTTNLGTCRPDEGSGIIAVCEKVG